MNKEINFEDLWAKGFRLATIGGTVFFQKGNMLLYYIVNSTTLAKEWRATTHIREKDTPYIPYELGGVKTMEEVLKWETIVNPKTS